MVFQWVPLCIMLYGTYFWKLFFVWGSVFWRERTMGASTSLRLSGSFSDRPLECEGRRFLSESDAVLPSHLFSSSCYYAPSSILAGLVKRLSEMPFHINPHILFPRKLLFVLCKGAFGFSEAFEREIERWLLYRSCFAEAACCIGRCDFSMRASKEGGFGFMQKNHTSVVQWI